MKKIILLLKNKTNLPKTIYFRLKGYKVTIYKGVNIYMHKKSRLIIKGKLEIGTPWSNMNVENTNVILRENSKLIINGYYKIYSGCTITVNKNGVLYLESGYINRKSSIYAFNEVRIGVNSIIGENVIIRDSDSHQIIEKGYIKTAPIIIGNKVWVGQGASILKGVKISDGAVIAANAVVTRNVDKKSLVGGVPAKVIRTNVNWKK